MGLQLAKTFYRASETLDHRMRALRSALGERAASGEPLARHTTFRIGGPADLFAAAHSAAELVEMVSLARQHHVPYLILGRGSNLLVADGGFRGLAIQNASREMRTQFLAATDGATLQNGASNGVLCRVEAESGVFLPGLAQYTVQLGLAGLEWAAGIPATLGGAIINNAGAFGGAMSDIVETVTLLRADGSIIACPGADLQFGYRTSRLKEAAADKEIVLKAALLLHREAASALAARMDGYLAQRREKQPKEPSAGSIFKNPPGDYAGRLIEQAGLKGLRIGDAQVSPKHANFIVNLDHAQASDVHALIVAIRTEVQRRFGVALELEIELVGEWGALT